MPEASVDEHRYSPPREDDVGPHARATHIDPKITAIPESVGVKAGTNRPLGLRVATPVRLHVPSATGRWRNGPACRLRLRRFSVHAYNVAT